MGKLAFLFAGQGAQAPGMGHSLHQHSAAARAVFAAADVARPGTSEDCFTADAQRLARTDVTQPCVFTVGLAAAAALAEAGVRPQGVAGFSLGEVAALTFAGAFTQADGFALVVRRAQLMQAANQAADGGMAAVLRLADDEVERLCARFDQLYPVNYNCPGQVVVAGEKARLPAFCEAVRAAGGTAHALPVGGAFHTPFMATAAAGFAQALQETPASAPAMPVYANLTACPYTAAPGETLARQMKHPVRWRQSMEAMLADGYDTFIEVGPGKTLCGFMKRIAPQARTASVQDADSLAAAVALCTGG